MHRRRRPSAKCCGEFAESEPDLTLRDVHAAAIAAGLRRSARGRLNVLALEGNPGIGKTTAVRRHLEQKSSGYQTAI